MLAYFLALVVGFGSLAIYLSAFFLPEIHRKNDFIWSGVGLFYGLILWIFSPRITGGLLLGHIASVALLVWFVVETLSLRRQLATEGQQTPLPSPESIQVNVQSQISKFSVKEKFTQLLGFIGSVFDGAKGKLQQTFNKKPVIKTAEEILQTTTTEATPPSQLADESLTVSPEIANEGLLAETVSPSPSVEMAEVAPTPPSVIGKEEEEIIPPMEEPVAGETQTEVEVIQTEVMISETAIAEEIETVVEVNQEEEIIPPMEEPVAGETQTVVEVIQTEVMISETAIAEEIETVVEVNQTEVVVAMEETKESGNAPAESSSNPVTSELLAVETAEKSDMTVEEINPEGEAPPKQIN